MPYFASSRGPVIVNHSLLLDKDVAIGIARSLVTPRDVCVLGMSNDNLVSKYTETRFLEALEPSRSCPYDHILFWATISSSFYGNSWWEKGVGNGVGLMGVLLKYPLVFWMDCVGFIFGHVLETPSSLHMQIPFGSLGGLLWFCLQPCAGDFQIFSKSLGPFPKVMG
ncbi:hypothetical protein L3X38_036664 [Prunus dulcis]|uniref:Uncharacterized protein n=1 Tax=Prunus dulcis TaxID=3755 RepID=A0AAD4YNT1_PRUDU|nr:hypothetical protein L3X38_036664 [Prunus dulcis]